MKTYTTILLPPDVRGKLTMNCATKKIEASSSDEAARIRFGDDPDRSRTLLVSDGVYTHAFKAEIVTREEPVTVLRIVRRTEVTPA